MCCTTIVSLFEAGFQFPRMHFFVVVPVEPVFTERGHQMSRREDLKFTSLRNGSFVLTGFCDALASVI